MSTPLPSSPPRTPQTPIICSPWRQEDNFHPHSIHDHHASTPDVSETLPSTIPIFLSNRTREPHIKRGRNLDNFSTVPRLAPSIKKPTSNCTIQLALLNVCSLSNKTFLINDFISVYNLDFMFLTETWLVEGSSEAILIESAPQDFSFMHAPRINRKGGGVAALYRDTFQCKQFSFGDFASFEYISTVLQGSPRTLFLTIYRPPKGRKKTEGPFSKFIDDLSELISLISTEFDHFAITGDLNTHIDNPNNNNGKKLLAVLDSFGLNQHVTGPTHRRGHTLDLVITKDLNITNVVVKNVGVSDHYCVFFELLICPVIQSNRHPVRKRIITENTNALFIRDLSSRPSLTSDSVDILCDNLNSKINNIMDNIAPIKNKTVPSKQRAPWRNSQAVINMKRECRIEERRWRKTKLQIHYEIYKGKLHAYNLEIKNARQAFFSGIINRNTNHAQTLFATVDRLTNPPVQLPPELCSARKCNDFASFFSAKISDIRSAISSSTPSNITASCSFSVPKNYPPSLSNFKEIDLKTLEEIVNLVKPSSCLLDPAPASFLKGNFNGLAEELLQIVNCSLRTGFFPESLKTAVIKPLLKKRNLDPLKLNNYRPISNLPFFSKILEKAVANQLNSFLNQNCLFDTFQSGFRPHHSTETALIKVLNDIRINNDSGKISILVLLDLSAAFDTIDHQILIGRLSSWIGLSGSALDWFRSYLKNRDYFVNINNFQSERITLSSGVPQGSILGPLLFNLHMLPLCQIF